MKRFFLIVALSLLSGLCFAKLYDRGFGKLITATVTPATISGFSANKVSVYNQSGSDVYVVVDGDADDMSDLQITNNVVIPAGIVFVFDCATKDSISKVRFATKTGTAVLYISCF